MPPSLPTSPGEQPRSRGSGSAGRVVLPLVPCLSRPPTRRRPLPDAAAVRLVVVPDSAPPYDDERPATGHASGEPRRLTLATGPRPVASTPPAGAPAAPADQAPGGDGQDSSAQREQAAAAGWPSQFAQVLAETLAGSRPQGQIAPWTTDQARRRIRQLGPMLAAGVQPRVRRVVTSRPTAGIVEMTVIVGFGPRIRALAVRLERDGPHHAAPGRAARAARWVCTVIEAA